MDIHAKTASDLVNVLFEHKLFTFLPQLSQNAKIFAPISATLSTAEKSFSTLGRLKSFLRSTMGQARLSSIAIINTERSYANRILQQSMDRIIDMFGGKKVDNLFFLKHLNAVYIGSFNVNLYIRSAYVLIILYCITWCHSQKIGSIPLMCPNSLQTTSCCALHLKQM